jgi:hypothetical protein
MSGSPKSPLSYFTLSPLGRKRVVVSRRQYEKGDFCERRLQIDQKLGSAHEKWLRAHFEMEGAYLNFELEIHIAKFILKILKKYHENQRKKLILTRYVLDKSKFHAKTLLHCV